MRKVNFRIKLFFAFFVLVALPFSLFAYLLDRRLEQNNLTYQKNVLLRQAVLLSNELEEKFIDLSKQASLQKTIYHLANYTKTRITIIDHQGEVLADSERKIEEISQMDNHSNRPEVKQALLGETASQIRYSTTLKINMLYVAVPIKTSEGIKGVVRLAVPLAQVTEVWATTRNVIVSVFFLAVVVAFLVGVILYRNITRPLNRIIYGCSKFGQGDFSYRVNINSNDEFGTLAVTLNRMAARIESTIKHLEFQNQQLRSVFESMAEGIIVVDSKTKILTVNSAIERIFQIERTEIEGKILLEALRNKEIDDIATEVLTTRKTVTKEVAIVIPVQRIFRINASVILEEDKEVAGCVLVIHDITHIRRLETVRSDFIANVSHELKTPLTSIKGFVETLREGALEDKENAMHFLEIIQEHTDRLNFLINDLLELSYLESKEVTINKEEILLKEVVDKVLDSFKAHTQKKNIKLVNDISSVQKVMADRFKLEQVFTNLVDNAIKFNHSDGKVRIYAQNVSEGTKIYVEDTGCGIPAKDLPRIFERFYRVDKARSRKLGGTGLGLSIVKHIVELHGGSVGVESTEGIGSVFWFILP
ncbi:MAG: cell wall metabolism sensor histidine kinase WalK [Candidatus Omnitrophica bacterium]|nr:cell wall metabolism sensor histidine kinase WalK [Candidatus Omnitrophota bacterium]